MAKSELLEHIFKNRFDMSDYLIHFTKKNDSVTTFENLKKIIKSGKLIAGWSVRNNKRTVFGKYPAVCFTEMPLFGFLKYVENRNNIEKVDSYGIAVSKHFMFNKGARNVIYGTSTITDEEKCLENGEWYIPNLPDEEQYRFMLTHIGHTNDWTHEREWRWRNSFNISKGDYLPIWKIEKAIISKGKVYGDIIFNQNDNIYVIVKSLNEAEELKELFNSLDTNIYNLHNIRRTYAIVVDAISLPHKYDMLTFDYLLKENACIPMHIE